MILQSDGDFQIEVGEVVTVTVKAINTRYRAGFSKLRNATWQIVQPPAGGTEIRQFTANEPSNESFTIEFDFVKDDEGEVSKGALYYYEIKGDRGPFKWHKRVKPFPPFPIGRQSFFEVVVNSGEEDVQ